MSRAAQAVEAGRVAQVLDRREALEEGGLDRDAVDQPLHPARLAEDVVAEDASGAAVLEQQRGEQAHERRLARAVLAQDGDALTARDGEGDRIQSRYAAPMQALAAAELLAQLEHLDRRGV